MRFLISGIDFRTADIATRERLAIGIADIPRALNIIQSMAGVEECLLVSTCNRLEVCTILASNLCIDFKDVLSAIHGKEIKLGNIVKQYEADSAVRHLCNLACGLESMVIGEAQILGQLKDAFKLAEEAGTVGTAFKYLFPQIFSLAKKVRTKTKIGQHNVSVSYVAVKLAQQTVGTLKGKNIMVIGAGKMGELALRNMVDAGVAQVIVANRTFQRAVEVAEQFNGVPIMLHEIEEYIAKVDIIISSVDSQGEPLLTLETITDALGKWSTNRKLCIVDISIPRSVDPAVGSAPGISLFNIDDLKDTALRNISIRQTEAEKAIAIIERHIGRLTKNLMSSDILPVMISFRKTAQQIRNDVVSELLANKNITDDTRNLIDSITKKLVSRLLHISEDRLRHYSWTSKK